MLEPNDDRRWKIDSRDQNQREMGKHRYIGRLDRSGAAAGVAERDTCQAQHQCAESQQKSEHKYDCEQGLPRKGGANDEKFAHEVPRGGNPAIATTPTTKPQPSAGCVTVKPPDFLSVAARP